VASRTFEPALAPPAALAGPCLYFAVRGSELLLEEGDEAAALPSLESPAALRLGVEAEHFLGTLDGVGCVALALADTAEAPNGMAFHPLRPLWTLVGEELFALAGRAVQIVEWDRTHRYCGRCGTPTEPAPGERAKRCPACGLTAFPRVAPAVIVRITRGDEILLAHGRRFPAAFYSVLAGFVDPGESLEECVAREVREEVGIEVRSLRYFGSQPWPFPHSLMVGFTAEYAGGELRVDPGEIVEARWFRRDALPRIPPSLSIARRLIDSWIAEVDGDQASPRASA
jgi:NAD+ diphosphatase